MPKSIVIYIAKDVKEIKSHIDRDLFSWEVAVTKGNTIYILDPIATKNKHTYKKNFQTILCHELSHVFYNTLIPEGVPYWLNEGLAYHLAGQKFTKFKYGAIPRRALRYYSVFDPKIYHYAPAFVDILIKKHSLKKIIKTIRLFENTSHHPMEFEKIFRSLL